MNLYSKDPEWVLEREQINDIKHRHGCAVCVHRDRTVRVFGRGVCGIESKYPGPGGFCGDWQYDEGVDDGGCITEATG